MGPCGARGETAPAQRTVEVTGGMENREARSETDIRAGDATLAGWLEIPDAAAGVVVFAHGRGSSRYSRRNNTVADYLREAGLGTLLFGEPGALEEVQRLARDWFLDCFPQPRQ